ncbi:MAG: transposase, partial [Planctomycetes bacterium]|nr:transposase [Planctomycetota bacterium]
MVEKFFAGSVFASVQQEAASREHFSVDGTLIQAWASMKSVRPKSETKDSDDSNSWHDFHGQNRSNETHESKTDPEAKLARKSDGKETKLSHSMHVLMENRHGFLMDVKIAEANGTAERIEALGMTNKLIQRFGRRRRTLGADKGYDDGTFLWQMEHLEITPHVAIRDGEIRNKSWTGRLRSKCRNLAQYGSYQMSQKRRRCSEALIGWLKKVAGLERT